MLRNRCKHELEPTGVINMATITIITIIIIVLTTAIITSIIVNSTNSDTRHHHTRLSHGRTASAHHQRSNKMLLARTRNFNSRTNKKYIASKPSPRLWGMAGATGSVA